MKREFEVVSVGDFSVSETRMSGRIFGLRKWDNHLEFHFPRNVRGEFE